MRTRVPPQPWPPLVQVPSRVLLERCYEICLRVGGIDYVAIWGSRDHLHWHWNQNYTGLKGIPFPFPRGEPPPSEHSALWEGFTHQYPPMLFRMPTSFASRAFGIHLFVRDLGTGGYQFLIRDIGLWCLYINSYIVVVVVTNIRYFVLYTQDYLPLKLSKSCTWWE